jgi:hypothetical protein
MFQRVNDQGLEGGQIKFNRDRRISANAGIGLAVGLTETHLYTVFPAIGFVQANFQIGEVSQGVLPLGGVQGWRPAPMILRLQCTQDDCEQSSYTREPEKTGSKNAVLARS